MRTPERPPRPVGVSLPAAIAPCSLSTMALLLRRQVRPKPPWLPRANVGEYEVEFAPTLVAASRTCATIIKVVDSGCNLLDFRDADLRRIPALAEGVEFDWRDDGTRPRLYRGRVLAAVQANLRGS
jgi:hypothetical protein